MFPDEDTSREWFEALIWPNWRAVLHPLRLAEHLRGHEAEDAVQVPRL